MLRILKTMASCEELQEALMILNILSSKTQMKLSLEKCKATPMERKILILPITATQEEGFFLKKKKRQDVGLDWSAPV